MERWFTYILFEEEVAKNYLDTIIFVANSHEKNTSHITIAGPYDKKVDVIDAKRGLIGTKVSIYGVGNFFTEKQNTVYLKCGSSFLERYWHKKDYKYRPHITIYDGKSRKFAEKLFFSLKMEKIFFSLTVGDVICEKSIPGQKTFDLALRADMNILSSNCSIDVNIRDINLMEEWCRIMIVERLFNKFTWDLRKIHKY